MRPNSGFVRFDESVIREIHARTPIAEYIGQYVPLRKRGNDMVGLCPFHAEKTPSFHVHPDRGFYKCFGCGEGGDVISFARKIENLDFNDAVRMLAGKAGVELQPENPGAARARSEKEAIYEANRVAADFFARALRGDAGARARDYCEKRGFSAATAVPSLGQRADLPSSSSRVEIIANAMPRSHIDCRGFLCGKNVPFWE